MSKAAEITSSYGQVEIKGRLLL